MAGKKPGTRKIVEMSTENWKRRGYRAFYPSIVNWAVRRHA